VVLAGEIVLRLADPGPSGSLAQRAAAVNKAICDALSREDVAHPKMRVAKVGGLWSVFIGKTFLVSVYPGDAKQYGLPPDKVAAWWAARFQRLFPLAQPVSKMPVRPGSLPQAEAIKRERVPVGRPVQVPREHWGLINRWLLLLWEAHTAGEQDFAQRCGPLAGQIIETASRHYFAPPAPAEGHEPGTCPALRSCGSCQRAMEAAVAVPENLHAQAAALAAALTKDAVAWRCVEEALHYVHGLAEQKFQAERVRVAWAMWQRLAQRAALVAPRTPSPSH
jgi:hypothetical protein